MTEKMGGAEGTKLDVDFVDMERVSSVFSYVSNVKRSVFHIFARYLCEDVRKEMTSVFYLLILLLNFKDFPQSFFAPEDLINLLEVLLWRFYLKLEVARLTVL